MDSFGKFIKSWGIVVFVCFALEAEAKGDSKFGYLGIGANTYNIKRVATSDNGSVGYFNSFQWDLVFTSRMEIDPGLNWIPSIAYTPLGRTSIDDATKVRLLTLAFPFAFSQENVDFKFGPGLLVTMMSGQGGTATLNNGNSTSTFGRPGSTSSARNLFLNLGLGMNVWFARIDFDVVVIGLFSSRRSFGSWLRMSFGIF